MDYAAILLQTQQLLADLADGSTSYAPEDYLKSANWAQEQAARILGLTYLEQNVPVALGTGAWGETIFEVPIPVDAIKVTRCEIGSNIPGPISIHIAPVSTVLATNGTQQFMAIVTGDGSHAVTWSVIGSHGTVDSNGLYTAGSLSGSDTVRVTSVQDPTKYADAVVTVNPAPFYTITVYPDTVTPTFDTDGNQTNRTFFYVRINHFNGHTAPVNLTFPAESLGNANLETLWNGVNTTGSSVFAPTGVDGTNTFEITGALRGWVEITDAGANQWVTGAQISGNDGVDTALSNEFSVVYPTITTTVTITSPL